MEDLISNLILLIAGVGIFMHAMHITSESMEKLASNKLRNMLNKVSGNKIAGVGIGAGVTALIQSSSATTVMVVGMVNAGILTLIQATNIIMGANIGTTITGLIAALPTLGSGGLPFSPTDLFMVLCFIGVLINLISKKDAVKTVASFMTGVGAIFVGLECMSLSMEFIKDVPEIRTALVSMTNPVILLLIGAVLTGIVQSSAAVAAIAITMAGDGLIIGGGGNAVLYVILGTNIGTCVTAILAGMGGTANGKRASVIHLLFNVIGSIAFFIVLLLWPNFYDDILVGLLGERMGLCIAVFHVGFNLLTTLMLLPFGKFLVRMSQILVKDKPEKSRFALQYLDDRILVTPSIALDSLLKETKRLAELSRKILKDSVDAFLEGDTSKDVIVKEEMEEISFIVDEITKFLVKLNAYTFTGRDELTLSNLHHIISDIERIADLATNIMRYTVKAKDKGLSFSKAIQDEVRNMYGTIDDMFELVISDFAVRSNANREDVRSLEDKVDTFRTTNLENHIHRMNKGECNPESGGIYVNTINNLERAADHLVFITDRDI